MASQLAKRFIPLMDRVLVQKIKPTVQTKSGLFLPESAKGASNTAKVGMPACKSPVLAVGAGRFNREGSRVPVDLKEGDLVIVPEYGGMPLKLEEEEFHVFRDDDIIGVLKEE